MAREPVKAVVVHSLWDGRTMRRMEAIRRRGTDGYDLQHIYPLRVDGDDAYMDEADLAARLDSAIETHDPDLVVIHTGYAFTWFRSAYVRVLGGVLARWPELRFATDNTARFEQAGMDVPLAPQDEVEALVRLLFEEP